MSFVHLHVHSQYSLLEATCRAKQLAAQAAEWQMPGLALTDYGNMYGAMEFYFACKDKGVNPIIGMDVFLAPDGRHHKADGRDRKPNTKLVLLAQSYKGYQNLCKLSAIGFQEGFYYKPRIDYEALREYNEDVIALSGGLYGDVAFHFTENSGLSFEKASDVALERIKNLNSIFPERFYLESCQTGVKEWETINPFLQEASKITSTPIIASNDVHYLTQDEQLAQEVLVCIGSNKTLHDDSRFRLGSDQFYFKSPDQMRELFKDQPEVCDRTLEISDRCNIEFKLKDETGSPIYHLPSYPTRDGADIKDEMRRIAEEGLAERFKKKKELGEEVDDDSRKEYQKRLDYELETIQGMGFNGYFLIVQDFINWAKENNIPVGPGRGSGAGSLVAYSLNITDLDPMPNNLIFERFLNPERISMPDFDIDFCQDRRGEVIDYVVQKYGKESVSQIITYGKLQARAALRDVGRVLGMLYAQVDIVAKLIPDVLGINLTEAIETEPRLKELMDQDPQVNTLLELALKVEGLVRHAGIHAAGVIIADGELVKHAPLSKGSDNEQVVQYDMKHVEKIGLIKFDFLGLKTLTHIHYVLGLIEKNRGKKIASSDISMLDQGIYDLMSEGDTAGVFQFEGEGITDATRKIKPSCFADIVAINALYRPGPMDMIPEYTKRKHGESEIEYLFPELEEILSETYGVIIYQEHVQLIAAKIASYTLGEADMLRRAMGKKIASEMESQKTRFMQGAKDNGHNEKKAAELFALMAKFAEYGFNKSHAAAYCVITGQTAWLKKYYTVEFFAGLLSTEMNDTDKVVKYIKDAQAHGIEVKAPHVNESDHKFTVKDNTIFFGIGAIKGVGQAAVEAILEARETLPNKKFESLEEFFETVDLRRVNKRVIECLIKAGGFNDFGANRSSLMDGYIKFLERAEVKRKDNELGQASLFDLGDQEENNVVLVKKEAWSRSARLSYEKEVLGFYLSDHPLRGYDGIIKAFTSGDIKKVDEHQSPKTEVAVVGLISQFKEFVTKKGTRMAFARLEDMTHNIELIVFPKTYVDCEMSLKGEGVLLITGMFEKEEGGASKILVDKVQLFEELLKKTKQISIRLDESMKSNLSEMKTFIGKHPGETPLEYELSLSEFKKTVVLRPENSKGISPTNDFFEGLNNIFGRMDFIQIRS